MKYDKYKGYKLSKSRPFFSKNRVKANNLRYQIEGDSSINDLDISRAIYTEGSIEVSQCEDQATSAEYSLS